MKIKLGDLISKVIDNRGRNPKNYSDHGHPVIDNNLIQNELYPNMDRVRRFITDNIYKNFIRNHSKKNDILITSVGNIGNVSLMPNNTSEIIQNTIGLRSNNKVNQFYLFYLLLSQHKRITKLNRGSVQPSVRIKDLFNMKVNIPPMGIQKKIAKVLFNTDSRINLNKQINKNLLNLMKNIYLKFSKTKKFKTTTINNISNGKIITGKTPSTKDKSNYGNCVPFIRIPNMHHQIFTMGTTRELSQKGATSQSKKFLPPFSLSVSCIGTPGLVTINAIKSQTNQQINSIIVNRKYLWILYIELSFMRTKFKRLSSGGTTMPNMNKTSFSKMKVNIFNDKDLTIFNSIASSSFYLILYNQKQNVILNKLKYELLLKFFK